MITAIVIILVGHFLFGFTLVQWISNVDGNAGAEFYRPGGVYGIWFYCKRIGKKRQHHSTFCQPDYIAAVFIGRYFFFNRSFSKMAATHFKSIATYTFEYSHAEAVAFEGQNLWDVRTEIGILLLWGIAFIL